MIAIIGCNGSMGRRYQAILKYLEKSWIGFDIADDRNTVLKACTKVDGVILCTPTDTHISWLEDLIVCRVKKILCEKPITKNLDELCTIYARAKESDIDLKMVMQYTFPMLIPGFGHGKNGNAVGDTYYDYFRHGNDGLAWDCLQIIALAKGDVKLYEESPIWRCVINGKAAKIGLMDRAYVWFINHWLNGTLEQDPKDIIDIHYKVHCFAEGLRGHNQGTHRHSS